MKLKAYQVTDDYEGYSVIVFADRSVVARRQGANELNIEFGEVESCKRMPEFDQYAETGVIPKSVLLAAGWWFECHHCTKRVDDWNPPYLNDDDVYCDFDCYAADRAEKILRQQREQALCEMVHEKFPGSTVTHINAFFDYRMDERSAWFKFPGGSGQASWHAKEPENVWVNRDDVPAWNRFAAIQQDPTNVCHLEKSNA